MCETTTCVVDMLSSSFAGKPKSGMEEAKSASVQFKPVVKMVNNPSAGLLIADEVGLGKTIEAGLVWTELRARFDAKNLLVLCPCPSPKSGAGN